MATRYPKAKRKVRKAVKKAMRSGKPSEIKKLSVSKILGSGTRKQRKAAANIKPTQKRKTPVRRKTRKRKV